MHLLVIEDERALCETIVRSLRRLAYSVDYCYDGEKALALLGVERYDLVLLDLNLPKKDGMTVLRTRVSRSVCRRVRSTVMPSFFGRFRSRSTRSYRSTPRSASAFSPS